MFFYSRNFNFSFGEINNGIALQRLRLWSSFQRHAAYDCGAVFLFTDRRLASTGHPSTFAMATAQIEPQPAASASVTATAPMTQGATLTRSWGRQRDSAVSPYSATWLCSHHLQQQTLERHFQQQLGARQPAAQRQQQLCLKMKRLRHLRPQHSATVTAHASAAA